MYIQTTPASTPSPVPLRRRHRRTRGAVDADQLIETVFQAAARKNGQGLRHFMLPVRLLERTKNHFRLKKHMLAILLINIPDDATQPLLELLDDTPEAIIQQKYRHEYRQARADVSSMLDCAFTLQTDPSDLFDDFCSAYHQPLAATVRSLVKISL